MQSMSLRTFIDLATPRLQALYGPNHAPVLLDEIVSLLQNFKSGTSTRRSARWDQHDVILICYGDSVRTADEQPLRTLKEFVDSHLKGLVSTIHVLPFFPYSSDDGFSVIDFTAVNPELGDWDDIVALRDHFNLMIDLVINHVSRESLWFNDFVNNRPPACYYFIEMDPQVNLSAVVRPRKSKVLTPVHTHRGLTHVWSTFSEDQIDLNFANPNVLREMISILLLYLGKGGRFIRLDAIAYLWKQLGTGCINLEQTHAVVKLLRNIIDTVAPDSILLTETNLPSEQNLSYFGSSDEAHMIYQFSLAPLLLHALHFGTGRYLNAWAKERCVAPEGCTFLNFTASHDGIGLRPAEGLVPQAELDALVEAMHAYGGFVSMKSNPDGSDSPYEINITYFDALQGTCNGRDQWREARFITSQAIMLAMKGIPALYFQSLVGCPNDLQGVETTGRTRSINRRKWNRDQLKGLLNHPYTANHLIFSEIRRLLKMRKDQSAFHPDAGQRIFELGHQFFVIERHNDRDDQRLLAISNLTDSPQPLCFEDELKRVPITGCFDLISQRPLIFSDNTTILEPYQTVWLTSVK